MFITMAHMEMDIALSSLTKVKISGFYESGIRLIVVHEIGIIIN